LTYLSNIRFAFGTLLIILLPNFGQAQGLFSKKPAPNSQSQTPQTRPRADVPNNIPNSIPQNIKLPADSTKTKIVKSVPDSLKKEETLATTVVYSATDSTIMDTENQVVYLYGEGKVKYGDIVLEADYIKLNWKTNEVFARGTTDSTTKKEKGLPVFTQGADTYDSKEIRYNFKSRKAIIKSIVTEQGDGFIQGKSVKKDNEDNLYIRNAIYTTCNLEHPHFNIRASKIKVVGKKEIVAGPFNFELNGIPLPIGLPFGFFPYAPPKESGTSGILMPEYGEDALRGFYLRNGGYYWAVSQHIGVNIRGQIYTKGGWGLGLASQYSTRYRFNGSFNVNYNRNTNGDEFLNNARNDFSIQWSHSPQSRGKSSFSASVNFQSSGYATFNSFDTQAYTQNTSNSSVQYSTTIGENIRTGASVQISQNLSTKQVDLNTNFNLGINQFQPFKNKKAATEKFLDQFRLGFDLSGTYAITNKLTLGQKEYNNVSFRANRSVDSVYLNNPNAIVPVFDRNNVGKTNFERDGVVSFTDSLGRILKDARIQMSYSIPISLPNIKLGNYINLTPGMSLSGNIYTRSYSYKYLNEGDAGYLLKDSLGAVDVRTNNGFYYDYNTSFSLSTNTRLYGTVRFKKGRLEAIRHVMTPSISASYAPDFTEEFYDEVQISKKGEKLLISKFDPTRIAYGKGSQSGGLSFSLQNTFEAKLKAKSDTAKKESEKVMLIDNLGLSTNYNFFAEQFKLSPISINANSRVRKFDINCSATLDPYLYEKNPAFGQVGKRVDTLRWNSSGGGFAQLTGVNIGISKRFSPVKKDTPKKSDNASEAQMRQINRNMDVFVDWSLPWNLSVNYNYFYSKQGFAPAQETSTMSFQGDVKLTEKWNFTLSSGYDFNFKTITYTQLSLHRDLHCWEMMFNWTPVANPAYGRVSNYSFDLRVKSALLQELKLSRRRSFYDRGGF
jgi:lipopolysaccharide assembly outer membrane protein LptD (OstA)